MGGLLTRSFFGKSLEAETFNVCNSKPPPNSEETLPCVIVGDEAFPLKKYLLRPYPGVLAIEERYQGKWTSSMLAGYCWTLKRDVPEANYRRKS